LPPAEDVLSVHEVDDGNVPFREFAGEDAARERVRDAAFDRAAERARPVHGIVPFRDQRVLGRICQLEVDSAIGQVLADIAEEQFDDLLQVILC